MVVGLSCIYDKKIMTYGSSCTVYSDMFLFLDDCRTVEFKVREANKALVKHVMVFSIFISTKLNLSLFHMFSVSIISLSFHLIVEEFFFN